MWQIPGSGYFRWQMNRWTWVHWVVHEYLLASSAAERQEAIIVHFYIHTIFATTRRLLIEVLVCEDEALVYYITDGCQVPSGNRFHNKVILAYTAFYSHRKVNTVLLEPWNLWLVVVVPVTLHHFYHHIGSVFSPLKQSCRRSMKIQKSRRFQSPSGQDQCDFREKPGSCFRIILTLMEGNALMTHPECWS